MTMYSARLQDQPSTKNLSKKKISELVYSQIANSLSEFHLSGKKFENKLKKVSKLFAKDIAKANRNQKQKEM
jgi:hypothetical protein